MESKFNTKDVGVKTALEKAARLYHRATVLYILTEELNKLDMSTLHECDAVLDAVLAGAEGERAREELSAVAFERCNSLRERLARATVQERLSLALEGLQSILVAV